MNMSKSLLLMLAGIGLAVGASLEASAWGFNCNSKCSIERNKCMDAAGNDGAKQGACHEQYRDCVNICNGGWID